ncbi:MAG: dephospho-CoA kinase [Clostridia bacterium]|nr:dephospho-CoA kinase [Clostridia bacterium]MBQ5800680.1 dephospho-CoA kinase [Clostridia bacterium]
MKILGLCGGSGSGKGLASKSFLSYGIPALDTDALYHAMIERDSECARELISEFGEQIKGDNGGINRVALRNAVFEKDGERLKRLDEIAHRHILAECRLWLKEKEKEKCPAAIIDAPLLFESGFDRECNIIISVIAPKEERIKRIMARDNLTSAEAEARIRSQKSDEFLKARSHYLIYNDGTKEALISQVAEICRLILK